MFFEYKNLLNEKYIFRLILADMHGVTAGNGCARHQIKLI